MHDDIIEECARHSWWGEKLTYAFWLAIAMFWLAVFMMNLDAMLIALVGQLTFMGTRTLLESRHLRWHIENDIKE